MAKQKALRLAMWSGPRNISTAMMRSWGNRSDTIVCDEPLYPHYLAATGRAHPGAAEVIAAGPVDLAEAINRLLAPLPAGKSIFYQKHMAHHLLAGMDRSWLGALTHCFLIRDPAEAICSFIKHVPDPTLEDTGYPQQAELFEQVASRGRAIPPVVDARDVLNDPRQVLGKLCERLGVTFDPQMLSWSPGPRASDGVWAKYWYKEVESSTSFRPYVPPSGSVPEHLADLLRECRRYYEPMFAHRIKAA
jgi:hypothetical protein